ncbi:hypothetical protein [Roseospira visakhapatnamensis]|uniref:Uncharacterized protein n=1 Tax=Roseospira visakhapatnamensis TaxID=390880 RepID=A0A7W6WBN7_9PROT|nr:hypothetical protein [Roseospira visakhapatnamensis]MBB4267737.1 hypothetical protein [Roseospira visakhapatnamensis]
MSSNPTFPTIQAAIDYAEGLNTNVYSADANPGGLDGNDGMVANFVPAIHAVARIGEGVGTYDPVLLQTLVPHLGDLAALAAAAQLAPVADGEFLRYQTGAGYVGAGLVAPPTIVTPSPGEVLTKDSPTLASSAYGSIYGVSHAASRWIVYAGGTDTIVYDSGWTADLTSHDIPSGHLQPGSVAYGLAVQHRDAAGVESAESPRVGVVTSAGFSDLLPVPPSVPAIGSAHAGGFYCGAIWDEVTTSSDSLTIATGQITVTVTDQAPLFYAGQSVRLVSRGDAGNRRMEGTVTSGWGTALVVNVTSITGAGTYTDWSVTARYRLVVAPKSAGESSAYAMAASEGAWPPATATLTNGQAATAALLAAGTASVYPAPHWAAGLTIGGRADWYVPARDEIEVAWRNLKPDAANNNTGNRIKTDTNYESGGNEDDVDSDTMGVNRHSSPEGGAYTTTVPGQTAVTAFMLGNEEAFKWGSGVYVYYVTSSEINEQQVWAQGFNSNDAGGQSISIKTSVTSTLFIRAMRREIY